MTGKNDIFGYYTLKTAFTGDFASYENLEIAKANGVKNILFSKGHDLDKED